MDETNPYAASSPDWVDPEVSRTARGRAKRLAADGAAVGSIVKQLEWVGVHGMAAESIALDAICSERRRQIWLGLGLSLTGLSVICVACFLTRWIRLHVLLSAAVFGAFLFLLGLTKIFHAYSPAKKRREKPRL